jgi:hypothetical protein
MLRCPASPPARKHDPQPRNQVAHLRGQLRANHSEPASLAIASGRRGDGRDSDPPLLHGDHPKVLAAQYPWLFKRPLSKVPTRASPSGGSTLSGASDSWQRCHSRLPLVRVVTRRLAFELSDQTTRHNRPKSKFYRSLTLVDFGNACRNAALVVHRIGRRTGVCAGGCDFDPSRAI